MTKVRLVALCLTLFGCASKRLETTRQRKCYSQSARNQCMPGYVETGIINRYDVGNLEVCCEEK